MGDTEFDTGSDTGFTSGFDPRRPFTRREGRLAGITDWQLRRHRRLFTNCYVHRDVPLTLGLRARGALHLAPPGALLARHTAAVLLGGTVPDTTTIHLALPDGRQRTSGIDARPYAGRVARVGGLPVTPAEETWLELAGELGLVDLVILGDSLVRAGRTTPTALREVVRHATQDVRRHARRAAGLVREGVDSPQETRLRLLVVLAGLPEPEVNHLVFDERGVVIRRYDLGWLLVRVALEYDGRQHAEDDEQWEHDVERREDIDDDEWRLVVVLAKGIHRQPGRTLRRVVKVLRSRGMDVHIRSDEWRLHFPERGLPGRRRGPSPTG